MTRHPRRPFRPRVEGLEDRSTPAVLTVNSGGDLGIPGDGLVTLREAITAANTDTTTDLGQTGSGADTIVFAPGVTGTIALETLSGPLQITAPLTIQGPGAGVLAVSGQDAVRVFDVTPSAGVVTISGLAIAHGFAAESDGGGIRNAADLTLTGVVVENNQVVGGNGGGASNAGRLAVIDSAFRGNTANGGAASHIFSDVGSTLVVDRSEAATGTVTNAPNPFAQIYAVVANGSTVSITNATTHGVRISGGTAVIRNMTASGSVIDVTNSQPAATDAAGLSVAGGATVTLTDSIVFGNQIVVNGTPSDRDVGVEAGSTFVNNNNIIGMLNGTPTGQDPLLGPLGNNGGPTEVFPLLSGSPALGAGTAAGAPPTDQRGFPRPGGGPIDVGAFQAQRPASAPDSYSTPFGQALSVPAAGVLANDSLQDPAYPGPLTATLVDPPAAAAGTVSLNPDGSFTFTPVAGFFGTTTFTYRATDGVTSGAVTTVTITVGPPPPRVFRYEVTGPPSPGATDAARVASGDVTGDGVPDVVVGSAPGVPAVVSVVDGKTRQVLFQVLPFGIGFTGGVFVAAGDVDGDGRADVAVTADTGGGPRVRVYLTRPGGLVPAADFLAVDPGFRGGLRVALGDVNHDGFADLVVVPGPGGGPRVATYDGRSLRPGVTPVRLWNDFFAFEAGSRVGAFVAAGDLDGDGFAEVVVGAEAGGGPRVSVFDGRGLAETGQPVVVANFFSGPATGRGGVRVAARDVDGAGVVDVVTGAGVGSGSTVRVYPGPDVLASPAPTPILEQDAFAGLTTGVYVA
jgi:hypothetical protein